MAQTKTQNSLGGATHTNAALLRLLIVAVVVIVLAAIYITWPASPLNNKVHRGPAYYPAPNGGEIVAGNPMIEAAIIGSRPRGFPADLPVFEAKQIVQAYRSSWPDEEGFHTAIAYHTDQKGSEVLGRYGAWLNERAWKVEFQPAEDPSGIYATRDEQAILVSMMIDRDNVTLVTVSYARQ